MTKGTSVVDSAKTEETTEADSDMKIGGRTDPKPESKTATPDRRSSGLVSRFADRPIRLKTLLSVLLVAALVVLSIVLAWQLQSKSSDLDGFEQAQADTARAEKISIDYATGAAEMNFANPEEWRGRLTAGTSPELANRLTQAATSMEQLIQPLQWTSTATPITAKVESVTDGVYQVVAFVNVMTKNTQTPDGIESTATYKMSIDSKNGWVITEISGTEPAVDPAAQPK